MPGSLGWGCEIQGLILSGLVQAVTIMHLHLQQCQASAGPPLPKGGDASQQVVSVPLASIACFLRCVGDGGAGVGLAAPLPPWAA